MDLVAFSCRLGGEEVGESPPVKTRAGPSSHLELPGVRKVPAMEDIPRAVITEVVEAVRGGGEEEAFRRSSVTLRSPTGVRETGRKEDTGGAMPKTGSLPSVMNPPGVQVEKLESSPAWMRRASTPVEPVSDVVETVDESTVVGGNEDVSDEASSTVFASSRATKRGRCLTSSGSEPSTSKTDDEGSATSAGLRQRRKRGRPRTTNIVDVIRERQREREEEKKKEREEWEEKRMADPNLVVAPATNLPSLEEEVGRMENQPTPEVIAEAMQVVRDIEKVATTSKNLKGLYVKMLKQAALRVHAGMNVLAYRSQREQGDDAAEVANLRRRTRSLRLEKEQMEKELEEMSALRKDVERMGKENMGLKGRGSRHWRTNCWR